MPLGIERPFISGLIMSQTLEAIDGFSEALHSIYDTVLKPERWPEALSRIGGVLDADSAVIGVCSNPAPARGMDGTALPPATLAGGLHEWQRCQSCSGGGDGLHPLACIIPRNRLCSLSEESGSPHLASSCVWQTGCTEGASVKLMDLAAPMTLSVMRSRSRGAFEEAETRTLAIIGRHVEQALQMSLRVTGSEPGAQAMEVALNAITAGVYVLDADRQLLFTNARGADQAETYFEPGMSRLTPQSEGERHDFASAIAAADRIEPGRLPQACVISGRDGGYLSVWAFPATPIASAVGDGSDAARTTLVTLELQSDRSIEPALIRDVFGLSLGEARLASLLWTGVEVREAAEHLGITEGTARVVLKRIFRKLGINRQVQLVLRLSQLAHVACHAPVPGIAQSK